MAKYDGKDMTLTFGGSAVAANTLVSVDFPETRDELDVTGAGQDDKEFLPSERSATITINMWDDAAETNYDLFPIGGAAATLLFYPQGNTTGKPSKSASAFVTSRTRPVQHNQAVALTVTLRVSGAVTEGTVS